MNGFDTNAMQLKNLFHKRGTKQVAALFLSSLAVLLLAISGWLFSGRSAFATEAGSAEEPRRTLIENFELESPIVVIQTAPGYPIEDMQLPVSISAFLPIPEEALKAAEENGEDPPAPERVDVPVTWTSSQYDPNTEGTYTITAVLDPGFIFDGTTPYAQVEVKEGNPLPPAAQAAQNELLIAEAEAASEEANEAFEMAEEETASVDDEEADDDGPGMLRNRNGAVAPESVGLSRIHYIILGVCAILVILLLIFGLSIRRIKNTKIDYNEFFKDL